MTKARFPKKFASKCDLNIWKILECVNSRSISSSFQSYAEKRILYFIDGMNDSDALLHMKSLFSGLSLLRDHIIDGFVGAGAMGIVFSLQDLPDYYMKIGLNDNLQSSIQALGTTKTSYYDYGKIDAIASIHANVLYFETNGTFTIAIIEKVKMNPKSVMFSLLLGDEADDARRTGSSSNYWLMVDGILEYAKRLNDAELWFKIFVADHSFTCMMNSIQEDFSSNPLSEIELFFQMAKQNPNMFKTYAKQFLELNLLGKDAHAYNFGTRENNPDKFVGFDI